MPNCTAYAFGRAYEILGYEPNLSHGNAQDWYGYNMYGGYYNYGSTPKVGAIACWSYSGGGHVAVVESVSNGTITLSNSAWRSTNFYLSYASTSDSNVGGNSWWNFQGYIYILDSADSYYDYSDSYYDDNNDDDVILDIADASSYSEGNYTVDTSSGSSLNMRAGAGTSNGIVTSVPYGTQLYISDIKAGGSYVWGYTSYNGCDGWVALDYCSYVSSEISENTDNEDNSYDNVGAENPIEEEPTEEITEAPVEEATEVTEPVTEEVTEPATEEVVEETTAPTVETTKADDFVLYVADVNGLNTIVYPLTQADQIADIELGAGNYNIYMHKNGEALGSGTTLEITAASNVKITYSENEDVFSITQSRAPQAEPTEETTAPVENATEATVAPTAETTTVPATTVTPVTTAVASTTSSTAPAATKAPESKTAATTSNTAIQTGQGLYVEGAILLTLSLTSLVLFWIKCRKYND